MKEVTECSILWEGEKAPCEVGSLQIINGHVFFGYAESWLKRGLEISPYFLPLQVGTAPISMTDPRAKGHTPDSELAKEFRGLPGPFYDSLPDSWGMKLLEAHTGLSADSFNALTILCHRGRRCMGAFSYHPASLGSSPKHLGEEDLELYCRKAAEMAKGPQPMNDLIVSALEESGGSAGGMRPKILLALPDASSTKLAIRGLEGFDHQDLPEGYTPWLLKFDMKPEEERGKVEHAFANLARGCGISIPPTQLIRTKASDNLERAHFAVQRFDRENIDGGWQRIHMHTAAGLLRRNFNTLDLDYTDLLELTKILTSSPDQLEECFRRAVFNVLGGNSDDHAKNHAFLMDKKGRWSLSPAYDLTPSRLRAREGARSTSVLGVKSEKIPTKILENLGRQHGLSKTKAQTIIEEVKEGLRKWAGAAGDAGISQARTRQIQARLDELRMSGTSVRLSPRSHTSKRHPHPPRPSRLLPAQYARLSSLVGGTPDRTNVFYLTCREALARLDYGEFSVDDLIDEALLRLYLGDLPKDMEFPKNMPDLIAAVKRLGKLHVDNTERGHRRHGPRPVSLDDDTFVETIAQASPLQTSSLQVLQIDVLQRLEGQLITRIAKLEREPQHDNTHQTVVSEIDFLP